MDNPNSQPQRPRIHCREKATLILSASVYHRFMRPRRLRKSHSEYVPRVDSVCYERGRVCQLRGFRHGTHCDLHYHKPCQNGTVRIRQSYVQPCDTQINGVCGNTGEQSTPAKRQALLRRFQLRLSDYELRKVLSTFRAAGISSMMLCQSLSQLDATYGQDNSTVILDN